ncbi:hypothetical protein [Steroidobacter sp.]|uniref:hypothetical protein n=1 Tax=Steroidobacter sp. TaxID=1978227 RepID=UPI0032C20D69
MRFSMLLPALVVAAGCTTGTDTGGSPRPEVVRDVEGYAIASCLVNQSEPYLKDQGDAWASVIVQRMKGDLEVFANIAERVKLETAKGDMAVVRTEAEPGTDKALPVLYCSEIIDKPPVRAAIEKAVAALNSSYAQ